MEDSPQKGLKMTGSPNISPTSKAGLREFVTQEKDPNAIKRYRFGGFGEYMASKKAKLKDQELELQLNSSFCERAENTKLFKGLSIHVNPACRQHGELRRMITTGGGNFEHYLSRRRVDFIVAPKLTNAKLHEFRNYKVVTPEFIIESYVSGQLMPWTSFRVKPESSDQRTISFQPESVRNALLADPFVLEQIGNEHAHVVKSPQIRPSDLRESSSDERSDNSGSETPPSKLSEWARNQTSAAPDFLKKYYRRSRLHWLSTWKAELKDMVDRLYSERPSAEAIETLEHPSSHATTNVGRDRIIMVKKRNERLGAGETLRFYATTQHLHTSFITFLGSLANSSAEIASCNYVARSYGIRNGSFLGDARKKCPPLVLLPYEFEKYKKCTTQIYKILLEYADALEAVSCDEALLDVTDRSKRMNVEMLATEIRNKIRAETQCDASIGISNNILLARMATKMAKPRGQFYLEPSSVHSFLCDKSVKDLPGVGRTLARKLEEKNVRRIDDLIKVPLDELQRSFGPKTGTMLYNFSRGMDERLLVIQRKRQSIGTDIAWGIRFDDHLQVETFVTQMAKEVANRMQAAQNGHGVRAKRITFKLKLRAADAPVEPIKFLGCGKCDAYSKSMNLAQATSDAHVISQECLTLLRSLNTPPAEIRGIGIQLQKLEESSGQTVVCVDKPQQNTLQFQPMKANTPRNDRTSVNVLPKPKLVITRSQFAEYPQDIQDELAASHSLVIMEGNSVDAAKDTKQNEIPAESELTELSVHDDPVLTITGPSDLFQGVQTKDLIKESPPPTIVALPPSSQLDVSVLAALPPLIRKQIQDAYNRNQVKHLEKHPESVKRISPVKRGLKSPRKKRSPLKNRPTFKHGMSTTLTQWSRAAGHDRRNDLIPGIPVPKSPEKELLNSQGDRIDRAFLAALPPDIKVELMQKYKPNSRHHEADLLQTANSPPLVSLPKEVPSPPVFHGARSVEDIRTALRNWMSMCSQVSSAPLAEDVNRLYEFAMNCFHDCDLERTRLVLRVLSQPSVDLPLAWQQSLDALCTTIQDAIAAKTKRRIRL